MEIEIRSWLNVSVLWSGEIPDDTPREFRIRAGLEIAVKATANLTGANLTGADLTGANLAGADLTGANAVIEAGQPNGWHCVGWLKDGVIQLRVGCRDKTLAEGRAYWAGKSDRGEVLAALDYIETVAKLRGWAITEQQAAA